MKRRLSMLLPLVFAFILTIMPFGLLEYNQYQRLLIKVEREKSHWEQNASNFLQMFRSLWSYESQLQRRMHVMHKRIREWEGAYSAESLVSDLREFFPGRQYPEYTYAGIYDGKNGSLRSFSGDSYARSKQRFFQRLLEGLARGDGLSANEIKSLDSFIRGAFGENLDFNLLMNFRRGKVVRAVFEGSLKLIYWEKIPLLGNEKKELIHLQVFHPRALSHLESMLQAAENLSHDGSGLSAVFVPLEFADPSLKPVFSASVSYEDRLAVIKALNDARQNASGREQKFPFGEAFSLGETRVLRDFIDYSVPYELWIVGRDKENKVSSDSFPAFVFRLFFFSAWILVMTRVLITGRPIGISLKAWLSLIFLVVGILPLIVFYVAGIFHIDSSAYRKEQEAIKDALKQMEDADASGEVLLAEYRDFCQKLDQDPEWLSLMGSWDDQKWEQAWEGLPAKTDPLGLKIEAMYVFPPDNASLTSRLFIDRTSGLSIERESRIQKFYRDWIRKAYFEIVPEIMSGDSPDLLVFKGRSGVEMMRYFLSNRGDIEFLDLEAEKQFLFQNYVLKNGKPFNWYFFRVDILQKFERYLRASIANLQAVFKDNIYSIAVLEGSSARIVFPQHSGNQQQIINRIAARGIDLAAVSRTRIIEQLEDYLVIAYPCVKSGPFVLSGIVFLRGFRHDAARQELLLSIIVILMTVPVVVVARFAAVYLVSPLIGVEKGLKKIADEDFSQKFHLKREDELGMLTSAFDRMTEGLKERKNLGRFVSASLDEQVADYETVAGSGMQKRYGAILCCDIRGFTSLSEKYPVREIVEMLNQHLAEVSERIQGNNGFIEQFIGDAVLAVFYGNSNEESVKAALNSAVEIVLAHRKIMQQRKENKKFSFEIGVGVDAGFLMSGIINTGSRKEFIVVGNVRSSAEKLESLTKKCQTCKIAVSQEIAELAGKERFAIIENTQAYELQSLERFA